eukprot:UN15982
MTFFDNLLSLIKNPSHINNPPPFKKKFKGAGAPPPEKMFGNFKGGNHFFWGGSEKAY